MSQPSKYLDYLYCNLGGLYPITRRENRFYLDIQDSVTGACYVEHIRTKS